MADRVQEHPRYQAVLQRYRAILEPGLGLPVDIEAAELSPDGGLVATVVRIADSLEGHGRTELRLVATDGSTSVIVTSPEGDVSSPRWSADGRLAFLGDHGHKHRPTPWLAELRDDGPPLLRELDSPPGICEHLRWSPDGLRLALTMAGEGAEQADGLGSGTVGQSVHQDVASWFPEIETTDSADAWRTAWVLDVASGASACWTPANLNAWEADWLGNDALVAVVTDAPAEDAWYHARLVRLEAGAPPLTLHVPAWQIQFAEGSPDGSRVVVIEGVASDRYYVNGDLVIAAGDGSGSRDLAWIGADVSAVRWDSPESLIAVGQDGMETVILRVDAGGGRPPEELFRTSAMPCGPWSQVSAVGGRIALGLSSINEPGHLALIEHGRATTLLGTWHAGRDIVRAALASAEVVDWAAPDGTRVQGILELPHGEPPFPTILWVHGGPVGAVGLSFEGPLATILLEAGYAILYPNPRGSTGRGRAYAAAVVGDMGGAADSGDLLAGIDHLLATGIADPARLVCAGFSYGGYMAALLPALDNRFAAALVGSPLTDLVSSYYGSSLTAFVHDYVGARPEADPQRYIARSSVFAGPRLRTPSMISVGLRDRATPPGQAMEHYRALMEQGTPAMLLTYPEEGHGVREFAARMDWAARAMLWLERFAPPDA